MYKCRECSYHVSSEADACPNCGNSDPFYEKTIINLNTYRVQHGAKIGWFSRFAIFFFVMVILNLTGIDEKGTLAMITFHISFWNIYVLIAISITLYIIGSAIHIAKDKEISAEIDEFLEMQRKLEI